MHEPPSAARLIVLSRRGGRVADRITRRVELRPRSYTISRFSVASSPRIFLRNPGVAPTVHPARPQRSGGSSTGRALTWS